MSLELILGMIALFGMAAIGTPYFIRSRSSVVTEGLIGWPGSGVQ